jgi:hypothetical protein
MGLEMCMKVEIISGRNTARQPELHPIASEQTACSQMEQCKSRKNYQNSNVNGEDIGK